MILLKKWAYYNEIDPFAAEWIRNLINAGQIAPGEVDERSIEDVRPDDVREFVQCHWFAGIAVWSLALRNAGWPDDRRVWTGSCPCQPFSTAGKGLGVADERHLWPAWHHLIRECRPATVFGEQVASRDADAWVDVVQDDMEEMGYAFGAIPFPAASVGANHVRDRLYWLADSNGNRLQGQGQRVDAVRTKENPYREASWLVDAVQRNALPYVCSRHDVYPCTVEQLRAYGNSIVTEAAETFIRAAITR